MPAEAVVNPAGQGANIIISVSILLILGAMGAGWLFRALLLWTLRKWHPKDFEQLGSPKSVQLSSLLPRFREMQIQFWKYLWEGRIFRTGDLRVKLLAAAALLADGVLVAGMVLLAWAAWR